MLRVEIQATGHGFFQRCCMFGNAPMGLEGRCTPISTQWCGGTFLGCSNSRWIWRSLADPWRMRTAPEVGVFRGGVLSGAGAGLPLAQRAGAAGI